MNRLPGITVSANKRFLVTENDEAFFWLGDTVWELFHRLDRESAERYLENRRAKGFTVIQAVVLAELDGLHTLNPYGDTPLLNDDPTHPNEAYFAHVDFILRLAAQKGLYIALLPTWADKVHVAWGGGPVIFAVENAYSYGRWLGERYRQETHIIWVLGGDRSADGQQEVWRAMAAGIKEGVGGPTLMTYHPSGGHSSSVWFHQEPWLDFNMIQSGHQRRDTANWSIISHDYALQPTKPVLDGEPNYEDHPINWNPANGYFRDHDVRKQAYRAVFAGACGHTYGNQCIWQCYQPGYQPVAFPEFYWYEALDHPGAFQLIHLRNLLLSRPYLTRIPDATLVASATEENERSIGATRDEEGTYALLYLPTVNQEVTVDTASLRSGEIIAWWYDPRTGAASHIGRYESPMQRFTTPADGPDWVLVLDVAACEYGIPGRR